MDVLAGALLALAWAEVAGAAHRLNYRGRPVSLAGGPALSVAGTVTATLSARRRGTPRLAAAALVAGGLAGAVGRHDDLVGGRPGQQVKGFAGHFGALRAGRLTSGVVKLAGLSLAGIVASALVTSGRSGPIGLRRAADVVTGAGVIAGTANLVNLLDLRPGRALKAGILLGVAMLPHPGGDGGAGGAVVAGPLGAAIALLPADLAEQSMLGDCGANSLGALLGLGFVVRTGLAGRTALLAGLAALTAASERVSFSRVIEETPALRRLDQLGRPMRADR
jgi:hypothetical protein